MEKVCWTRRGRSGYRTQSRIFQNVIEDNLDSAHIFVIVSCCGGRFTEEDQAVIGQRRKKNMWPGICEGTCCCGFVMRRQFCSGHRGRESHVLSVVRNQT
ncbi:hypothetical protein PoB_003448800 [Plakobranchus ocellatus]|uniref:C2H2-type domain-containing protein n=1 Tax=Plakobranchus ocellatus TaxID=259542 RepID=A0AAV4AMG7_9GAST|nr:hypothetical protein PoB_003448800 [Plakobranchus ocellatus]